MNAITFGQVSKMYQYAPTDIRTKISKRFGGLTEKQLHQLITIVARCRNVCAHGERLYSFRIRETIPDMPLHDKLKIVKKKGQFVSGKSDLFAVVIALRYLIGNEDFKKFKTISSKVSDNSSDSVLVVLSNMYSFNYKYSYYLLRQNDYIAKILDSLTFENKEIENFFRQVMVVLNNYIDKRIGA